MFVKKTPTRLSGRHRAFPNSKHAETTTCEHKGGVRNVGNAIDAKKQKKTKKKSRASTPTPWKIKTPTETLAVVF